MSEKITYVCVTQNRVAYIKRNIPRVIDYVDRLVIVDGFSTDGTKEWLEAYSPKIKVVQRQWDDSFARQYNRYLEEITDGWIFICDDDEMPTEALCKALRTIVDKANMGRRYDVVEFRGHNIQIDDEGKITQDHGAGTYYRQLLHRYNPGMHYEIDLHQSLRGHKYGRVFRTQFEYFHIKTIAREMRDSCRNWWISGVWNDDINAGVQPPEWHTFRKLVLDAYPNVKVFADLDEILKAGNIDQKIKDYLSKVVPFLVDEGQNRKFWELKQFARYYFNVLHPSERPADLKI